MKKILIDSGPLIALFDRNDKYHQASVEFIKKNRSELVTTLASITEVLHLLDFNRNAQIDFLNWVDAGAVTVEAITTDDFQRIRELIIKYSDLPMDFTDACLVVLGEKLNISKVATIDRDFDIYRLKGKRSFTTYIK
ncbi:MAG: PIN domain-containing protein [Candidatus Thiodiazotropha sp. (ex Dulcina madagascariensis)]|nr:PIN domain-containing protein [Candidatus Thiodiazotropha sp. (ex Dulcina madagascariensis)]